MLDCMENLKLFQKEYEFSRVKAREDSVWASVEDALYATRRWNPERWALISDYFKVDDVDVDVVLKKIKRFGNVDAVAKVAYVDFWQRISVRYE